MVEIASIQNADSVVEVSIAVDDLIITRKGGSEGNAGTWIHPKHRMVFSRWMSEEFDFVDLVG